jgi:hypothetical protein
LHNMSFFFAFLFPALFIFLIFRFGIRFFNELFNNPSRLNSRDRWQLYHGTGSDLFPPTRARGIENRIFRAASKRAGRLTVSDIVLETDLSIREAEEVINGMVDGTHVRMEVEDNGLVVYEFPEIISRLEKE